MRNVVNERTARRCYVPTSPVSRHSLLCPNAAGLISCPACDRGEKNNGGVALRAGYGPARRVRGVVAAVIIPGLRGFAARRRTKGLCKN